MRRRFSLDIAGWVLRAFLVREVSEAASGFVCVSALLVRPACSVGR